MNRFEHRPPRIRAPLLLAQPLPWLPRAPSEGLTLALAGLIRKSAHVRDHVRHSGHAAWRPTRWPRFRRRRICPEPDL